MCKCAIFVVGGCIFVLSNVCSAREKDKRERGNTPKHTKRRRGNAPKRSTGPHAVHGQKTDTITLRIGNPKNVEKGNSKTPKGRKTQKHVTTLDL